jgi:hypothetical protein
MVTRTKVDLGENSGSSELIKKNIDLGKRIFVLDGHCIERSVIHTKPQATIFLLDKESGTTQGEEHGRRTRVVKFSLPWRTCTIGFLAGVAGLFPAP